MMRSLPNPQKPSTLLLYCTSSTRTGVFSIVLSTRRNITFTSLSDSNGCERGCSCITDQHEFIVGRSTGLYRFQNGEECGCYSIPGAKQFVQSFKDCIFVSDSHEDKQRITIYNMQAHFIEYQGYVLRSWCAHSVIHRNGKSETITDVYTEWGDIFITTAEHSVFCYHKLDLQTKLHTLYEQKLFSVALTLAHNNNLYYGSIVEIHKLS